MVVSIGMDTARRLSGMVRRQMDAMLDEDAARGGLSEVESQSSVVLQDAVLNDLSVLATLGSGPLPSRLRTSLRDTLQLLAADRAQPAAHRASASSSVQRAIDEAVGSGLVVRVIGEVAVLEALDGSTGDALGAAVEQCLATTLRHAATDEAEITVLSDEGEEEVSIMVVEAGTGADGDDDSDELRTAVEERIEGVGGSVLVFSRPGVGTTVLLTVPRDAPLVGLER